jgi:uncharacterized RDD family membrane protein YckC
MSDVTPPSEGDQPRESPGQTGPGLPPPPAPTGSTPPSAAPPAPPPPGPPPQAPPLQQPGWGSPPYGQPPAGAPYGYVPGPVDRLGRPLADWWQRLVAIILDSIILYVPKAILAAILVGTTVSNNGVYTTGFGASLIVLGIIFALVDIAYFALLNGSEKGQTVGQMVLGIAVRDESTGGAIGPQRAGLRILVLDPGLLVSWIPVIGLIAGLYTVVAALSPLWDDRRQGFHDKVAKTDVIKVR